MDGYFSAKEVVAITGVRYRQLDYWLRQGIVRAAIGPVQGEGELRRRRLFSFSDLVEIRTVLKFVESGVRPHAIRGAVIRLRRELRIAPESSFANVRLITDGRALFRLDPAFDVLIRLDGSEQLAFAFELGDEVRGLVSKIQAQPKRSRYEKRNLKKTA